MGIRIRYTDTQVKGIVQSKNIYHHRTNGARYRVSIDLRPLEVEDGIGRWSILDNDSGKEAVGGNGTHAHKLKIAARNALVDLGIVLEVEERERLNKSA